jgi:hypothetical protein
MVGALLKDAAKLLAAGAEMLAPEERRFVELSIAEDRKRRGRIIRRGALAAAAVGGGDLIPAIGFKQIAYGFDFARHSAGGLERQHSGAGFGARR